MYPRILDVSNYFGEYKAVKTGESACEQRNEGLREVGMRAEQQEDKEGVHR